MTRGAVRGLSSTIARLIADVLASALVLTAVGWAMSFQRQIGLDLYPQQFFAAILFFTVPLAFLTLPARKGSTRDAVPWLDVVLALIAMAAIGYIAVGYPRLVLMIFSRPAEIWIPGIITVVLLL